METTTIAPTLHVDEDFKIDSPCWVILLVKLFFYESSNILLEKRAKCCKMRNLRENSRRTSNYLLDTFSMLNFVSAWDAQSTASCCIPSAISAFLITAFEGSLILYKKWKQICLIVDLIRLNARIMREKQSNPKFKVMQFKNRTKSNLKKFKIILDLKRTLEILRLIPSCEYCSKTVQIKKNERTIIEFFRWRKTIRLKLAHDSFPVVFRIINYSGDRESLYGEWWKKNCIIS